VINSLFPKPRLIGCCLLGGLLSSLPAAAQSDTVARYPTAALRAEATVTVLPTYPQDMLSLNKGGLVVVRVTVAPDGQVQSVQDLESFDAVASHSVRAAVSQWRFRATPKESPLRELRRTGKLLFLFRLADGHPTVIDLVAADIEAHGGKVTTMLSRSSPQP